jgi:predicted RNase H-like HicB family nuclease
MSEISVVHIRYHFDGPDDGQDGAWWADSPDVEGFSAAGDTFEEVRRMAHQGIAFFVGQTVAVVEEGVPVEPERVPSVAKIELTGTFTGSLLGGAAPLFKTTVGASTMPLSVTIA